MFDIEKVFVRIYIRLTYVIGEGYDTIFFVILRKKKQENGYHVTEYLWYIMHSIVIPYLRFTTCVFCTQRVDHGFCKTSTLTNSFVNLSKQQTCPVKRDKELNR